MVAFGTALDRLAAFGSSSAAVPLRYLGQSACAARRQTSSCWRADCGARIADRRAAVAVVGLEERRDQVALELEPEERTDRGIGRARGVVEEQQRWPHRRGLGGACLGPGWGLGHGDRLVVGGRRRRVAQLQPSRRVRIRVPPTAGSLVPPAHCRTGIPSGRLRLRSGEHQPDSDYRCAHAPSLEATPGGHGAPPAGSNEHAELRVGSVAAGSAPDQALHLPAADLAGPRPRAHLRGRVPLPGPQGADPPGRPRFRDADLQRLRRSHIFRPTRTAQVLVVGRGRPSVDGRGIRTPGTAQGRQVESPARSQGHQSSCSVRADHVAQRCRSRRRRAKASASRCSMHRP